MDYDSPDWDRTPTESIEVKEEMPHLTKAEADAPSPNDPKLELTKKEEDSPQPAPMLCPPVSAVPDKTSTTSTTPPAKAPPVSHTSYRNLSTRNTPQTNPKTTPTPPDAIPPHTTPAPPSTTSSSPPMFPFYRKHVRGTHPSILLGCALHNGTTPTLQQHPHATLYRSLFHVPTGTANLYPSTFPTTSSITSIPQHTPLDDQSHPVPHHHLTFVQPILPTPLQFFHRYPPFPMRH